MADVRRVKAIVEYDGTAYQGFQIQANGPTIQGALEKALQAVTQSSTRIVGAGRTDAGVHARGQVIHCDITWAGCLADLERAWNAMLPADIAVHDLTQVSQDFHARFTASSREYRYSIYRGAVRSPLVARFSHHVPGPLDIEAMAVAARSLIGQHDFSAFGRPPYGTDAVRTVHRAAFKPEGNMLYFDIEADAFLRHMVRSIVGTLLLVGRGTLSPQDFTNILLAGDPNHPVALVPSAGLCLMRVNYPCG